MNKLINNGIFIAILTTFLYSQVGYCAERVIDLNLQNMSLKEYRYTPDQYGLTKKGLIVNGVQRSYFIYSPVKLKSKTNVNTATPILVALHGAGRDGASMIDTWKAVAKKHGFIVIAPNGHNKNWHVNRNEADLIRLAVQKTLENSSAHSSPVYLFGHSNGARQAISEMVRYPTMYAGVAVHAGTLPMNKKQVSSPLITKTKLGLFLGDSDHIFSITSGRQTVDWLYSIGIQSDFFILKRHSHWYYHDANRINEYIWQYLNHPQ